MVMSLLVNQTEKKKFQKDLIEWKVLLNFVKQMKKMSLKLIILSLPEAVWKIKNTTGDYKWGEWIRKNFIFFR